MRLPVLILLLSLLMPALSLANPPASNEMVLQEAERLRQDMNDPVLYLQLIAALQQRRLFYAALAHLDVFDSKWPNDSRALLQRADALRQIQDVDAAQRIYQRLLTREASAGAHHGLGLIAAQRGALDEALVQLQRANQLAPIDTRILNDLGYLQLLTRQYPAARLSLNKAVELEPANRQAVANLALYHLLVEEVARAEQLMLRSGFDEQEQTRIREEARGLQGK